jgi:hypothetical protein
LWKSQKDETENLQSAAYRRLNGMFGSDQAKNARQLKSKVNSMFIIIFDIKGIVHKEFVLACQIVNFTQLPQNVLTLHPELWQRKDWLLYQENAPFHTLLFHKGIFHQKQHDCRPLQTQIRV